MSKIQRNYFYFAKCLETGHEVSRDADSVCESASTIKIAILIYVLTEVEKGNLSLRQRIKLKKEHHSRLGSGLLNNFYKTQGMVLHDLALMMIIISDNIATNALIELLGKDNINNYLKKIGFTKTRLIMSRLTFPDNYSLKDERIGETTPREMATLLEQVLDGELLSSTHTKLVIKFLKRTQSSLFGRQLPTAHNTLNGVKISEFGNKTGACFYDKENQQVLNDCGFFKQSGKKYTFAVYSSGEADTSMQYAADSFPRLDFAKQSKRIYKQLVDEPRPH